MVRLQLSSKTLHSLDLRCVSNNFTFPIILFSNLRHTIVRSFSIRLRRLRLYKFNVNRIQHACSVTVAAVAAAPEPSQTCSNLPHPAAQYPKSHLRNNPGRGAKKKQKVQCPRSRYLIWSRDFSGFFVLVSTFLNTAENLDPCVIETRCQTIGNIVTNHLNNR